MCPKIEYLGIERTAERLGLSRRRVQEMCAGGNLPGAVKKDGAWRVPVAADAAQRDKSAGETPATRDTRYASRDTRYASRDTSNNVPEDRIFRNRADR